MSHYQENKHNGGLTPLAHTLQPDAYVTSSAPTISDFIGDIETGTLKSLDEAELSYFNTYLKSCFITVGPDSADTLNSETSEFAFNPDREQLATISHSLATKLGSYFIKAGIYPLAKYLAPSA